MDRAYLSERATSRSGYITMLLRNKWKMENGKLNKAQRTQRRQRSQRIFWKSNDYMFTGKQLVYSSTCLLVY